MHTTLEDALGSCIKSHERGVFGTIHQTLVVELLESIACPSTSNKNNSAKIRQIDADAILM